MIKEHTRRAKQTRLKVFVAIFALSGAFVQHARAEATGGYTSPYFQADYVQDLSEFSSGIVNPALLYRIDQLHANVGIYRWNFDFDVGTTDLGYQQASFLVPIRLNQTAGITIIGIGGDVMETQISGAGLEDRFETRYGDFWFVGHYAVRLLPWLMIGANPKFIMQTQFNSGKAFGVGLDAGLYFNPIDNYRLGDLGLSLTFQDIVPAKVKWQSQNGGEYDQLMTTRFRAGIRYAFLNDRVIATGEYLLDNAFANLWQGIMDELEKDADSITIKPLTKVGRLSGHVKMEFIPQLWLKLGWGNNNIPYFGLNLNLIYPLPEMINYASVDAHIGYSVTDRERGLSLMGKFSTEFGPTREQRESKRLYDKLILAPMNAYNEAMRLYLAKRYWEASFAFGKVISLFPNFHLNDKATFYMGNCYRYLRLNELARETYKEGLEEYTTSEVRPKYLYGLQDLDYREGKYEDALKNHAFITNLYAESEIRPDADYLAGQIHFKRKNYNAAEQLLSNIKPESPVYLYAQYTLSIINIENNKLNAAMKNLLAVTSDTTQDAGVLLLQDAANTKLGQLYFEQVDLRKAVEVFDRVPEGSAYGDEALLGIAWSWIKVNRPEMALSTVDRLIAAHPQSPLIPETHLVRGYALMLVQRVPEAMTALETSIEMAKKDFADEDDLAYQRKQFDGFAKEFAPFAEQIKKNALRKPTPKTEAERPDLKTEYDQFSRKSREFFEFAILVDDNQKFFRRREQIIMDAEYALAKAIAMQGGKAGVKQEREKAEKLDEEIERLKRELEKAE